MIEMQHAIIVIGALLLLGLTFYVGTKYSYTKYLIANRHKPMLSEKETDRFPGIASEDLIRQAILAQKEWRWQEAADRFMAAKRKDLGYRGILYRVGAILYVNTAITSRPTKRSSARLPSVRIPTTRTFTEA